MNFFIRNVLLLHILALALAFSWIHGGTRPDLLLPVIPWLSIFALEFLLVFPQAKSTETLMDARSRVWRALVRDPLFYASLALTILLAIPLFNVSGLPVLDAGTGKWVNPLPPIAWLPSCAKAEEQAVLLLWFPPALVAALAAKHGLLKKGKRLLLEGLCWNGAALSVLGFMQLQAGARNIFWAEGELSYFFSTFGYPNFAGAFFTLLFALSAGLWFGRASSGLIGPASGMEGLSSEESTLISRHYLLIPVVLNLVGAVASLSRAAILLCAVSLLALVAYMAVGVWQRTEGGGRIKLVLAITMSLFVGVLSLTVFAPKSLKAEIVSITPGNVLDRVSGRAYYHARVAKQIFRDHPAFGVGGWGYPHYLMQYLKPDDIKHMQIQGGANVHNDTLQFLAEQGAVGFGLILTCALALVVPLTVQAAGLCIKLAKVGGAVLSVAKPAWLYRLPPAVVAVFVGAATTVCHSLGDLPFRDPAILLVWLLSFACAPGFIPVVRKN